MKTVMILGGGIYQVPLIQKAKAMGLKVIVVTYKGNYPGIPLADIFLDLNTTDAVNIAEAAEKYHIDAILTTGTDVCVPSIGYVVDKLHLVGPGYEAACRSMDKVLMKRAFMDGGVRTAAYDVFDTETEASNFACHHGFPMMVKAPDSSGSRGVSKVNSREEFHDAWEYAQKVSKSGKVIVEQYLSGIEFGAQAFIQNGSVIEVFPHGDTVTPPPYCTPVGHSVPTVLNEQIQEETKKLIGAAAQALGIDNCIANVDLILVDEVPYILEIGARMGATCLPENISIYAGQDVYEYLIRLALGEKPDFIVTAKQPNACLLLRSDKDGVIVRQEIPEEIKQQPGLCEVHFDYQVGDVVRKFKVGPDRIGHIIVKADSAIAAEKLCKQLADKLIIEVK